MSQSIIVSLLCLIFGASAQAFETKKIIINPTQVQLQIPTKKSGQRFSEFSVQGFEQSQNIGAPQLPVKSWLLKGTPEKIQVAVKVKQTQIFKNVIPSPAQEKDCRCETTKIKTFSYNTELYEQSQSQQLTYLGAFRGQPITRLDVYMAQYDAKSNNVTLNTELVIESSSEEFSLQASDYNEYLIIAPAAVQSGLTEFMDYKKTLGFNVNVETYSNQGLAGLKDLIRKYYTEKGVDFVMLIGDETTIPMDKVDTSGSDETPSDLRNYTMDGETDTVPDMFYSRIVASTAEGVQATLHKSIEFEQKRMGDISGFKKMIGVASDEGRNPSDDEYVRSIEQSFQTGLGISALHLYQKDSANSKPAVYNRQMDEGAFWVTYLGHGSGTSWPSFASTYSTTHIRQINNLNTVKPVVIDVACMNGKLVSSYLGASFMKAETVDSKSAFGAAAYYGGTVNISWHPPAVMAQGIAFEHVEKKFKYLGEALLAGHLYLAARWTNKDAVVDNFEWYHLQGDPGLNIQF